MQSLLIIEHADRILTFIYMLLCFYEILEMLVNSSTVHQ